jgi:hypothetical protein
MSYWTEMRQRALPALVVGVVVGVVFRLLDDWSAAWIVGGAGFLSTLLLPARVSGFAALHRPGDVSRRRRPQNGRSNRT